MKALLFSSFLFFPIVVLSNELQGIVTTISIVLIPLILFITIILWVIEYLVSKFEEPKKNQ